MKKFFSFFKGSQLLVLLVVLMTVFLAAFSVRGRLGDPLAYQKNYTSEVGSPFESSGSASRYALTESIVLDHSFFLSGNLKQIAFPDIVQYQNNYFSIFTPGISFIGIPFYILGELLGLPQLLTYLSITIISIINVFLIAKLARYLGVGKWVSYLSGLIFYFATNALSYGATFTQHQVTVLLVLLSLVNARGERTVLKDVVFGLLFGFGALVDIPVVLMLSPIAIYIFFRHFQIKNATRKVSLTLKSSAIILLVSLLPFLGLFAFYNYQTTGSLTKIGQSIGRVDNSQDQTLAQSQQKSSSITLVNTPFLTRNELNSLYILLLSNERSWLFYSPVVLLGILGFYLAFREKRQLNLLTLIISVILLNIVVYSMFGDPWGGWSFGPRYLIPAAAMMSLGVGLAIQKLKKNIIFLLVFFPVLIYSVLISVAGAITSNLVPPKIEAVNLSSPIPYTYQYNFQLLSQGQVSSLIYNLGIRNLLQPVEFYLAYSSIIILLLLGVYILAWRGEGE